MTGKKKIRYAVVGLGYIAQKAVLPAFRNAKANSRLAALSGVTTRPGMPPSQSFSIGVSSVVY